MTIQPIQLQGFVAVAEELHFGRAAARMHMAQPPLSRMIQRLEASLHLQLFERSTRSVELTAGGRALVAPAREALDALARVGNVADALRRGETGRLRVAFAGPSTHRIVAELARTVRTAHPGITLELDSQNFAHSGVRKLLQGDADLVFGRWDNLPDTVQTEVIMHDSLTLAVPSEHHLAGLSVVTASDLTGERFVSLPDHEGAVLAERLNALLVPTGRRPVVVQVAPDTQTALALVSAGVGAMLTLESVAVSTSNAHLRFIPVVSDQPSVDLRMAWRTSDAAPAFKTVLRAALDIARSR